MTAREHVLASRLIQKIDKNNKHAKQIGLSYTLSVASIKKYNSNITQNKEKKN